MRVGVVREIKPAETRVALTPAGAVELTADGHRVLVENGAGIASGFQDSDYAGAGAEILGREEIWSQSELLLKVKEPIDSELGFLREDLTLMTYLHLAAEPTLLDALVEAGTTAIALETIEDSHGHLPLLAPMSEVAGRLAAQSAAYFLQAPNGGCGVLMGGAPGVQPARVVVIGGGTVGTNAARVAVGMGAEVTILERSLERIRELEDRFEARVRVLASDRLTLSQVLLQADAVVGAVLIPGARAPHVIAREMLSQMQDGTVIVDVAIDQGGCVETSRPTTHSEPTFVVDGVLHYCVTNMPGAVPVTSTRALTNATLPYVREVANHGVEGAGERDPGFVVGVNTKAGAITNPAVAESRATLRA